MKDKIYFILIALGMVSSFAFNILENKQEEYTIDAQKTKTTWVGTKVTGKHEGGITISKGNILYDGSVITGGNIEFDMTSITCSDIIEKERNDKLVRHLKSEDFFGVEEYTTSLFQLKRVRPILGDQYNVTGDLTIKGITHEITFSATIKVIEKSIITVATIFVDRTIYGIKYGSASFFDEIGDKAIDDNFELRVQVVATVQ